MKFLSLVLSTTLAGLIIMLMATPLPAFSRDILIPDTSNGVWHGAWLPIRKTVSSAQITEFENLAGKKIGAQAYYAGWYINAWDSIQRQLNVWEPMGIKAHIVWEPRLKGNKNTLDAILNGSQDAVINDFARKAKSYGKPFFLRFAHEMNGNWYPWSGAQNGGDPQKYIKAWRYVWNKFQEAGVTNAVWVWSPNAWSVPAENWNNLQNYYPGDVFVDWVGVDFFGLKWDTIEPGIGMDQVYSSYSHKPIMISETAAADCSNYLNGTGLTKDQWIKLFFNAFPTRPAIKAFFWFNENKEADWRISSCPNPAALEAYRTGIANPRFKTR